MKQEKKSAARRRFPRWKVHVIIFGLIALFAMSPILVALTAGLIASVNDCQLDEGGVNPCIIAGRDYGTTRIMTGVSGWYVLWTPPVGVILAVGYAVAILAIWLVRRGGRRG